MHDIDDVCEQFRHWRQKYNSVRLHEALGMMAPAEVYIPSGWQLPEKSSRGSTAESTRSSR